MASWSCWLGLHMEAEMGSLIWRWEGTLVHLHLQVRWAPRVDLAQAQRTTGSSQFLPTPLPTPPSLEWVVTWACGLTGRMVAHSFLWPKVRQYLQCPGVQLREQRAKMELKTPIGNWGQDRLILEMPRTDAPWHPHSLASGGQTDRGSG